MEVVPLTPAPNNERLHELVGEITELVANGNIVSLAFVAIERDQTCHTGWSASLLGALLGALARLAHRINVRMDENNASIT